MADLPINQLPEITAVTTDTLFVVSQGGTTYKVKAGNTSGDAAYGQFISTSDQLITGSVNNSYIMSAGTTLDSYGVSVVDNSKFTFLSGGTYNFAFSAQLAKVQGVGTYTVSIWLTINGVPLVDSTGDVVLVGTASSSAIIAAWPYLLNLNAGDYVQLAWSSDSVDAKLYSIPTRVNPTRPASPSLIVTINQL
jgi:hypothetical protein